MGNNYSPTLTTISPKNILGDIVDSIDFKEITPSKALPDKFMKPGTCF